MELSAKRSKTTTARHGRSPVKWQHSMYFRVLVLCCVLLLCLFASIFIIVRYTIGEAIHEVESESREIAKRVLEMLKATPLWTGRKSPGKSWRSATTRRC